ncbi:mCG148124 [Mus musculus]|nr:mCG148124 [Mus musculus]
MWLLGFELRTFGRAVGCSYPLSHLTSLYVSSVSASSLESTEVTDWCHCIRPPWILEL